MSCPWKQLSDRRMPPLPGNSSQRIFSRRSGSPDIYLNPDDVKTYLSAKPWLLKEYVLEYCQLEEVVSWFEQSGDDKRGQKKRRPRYVGQPCDDDVTKCQDPSIPISSTVKVLEDQKNVQEVLMPTMTSLADIVDADEHFLFMVSAENQSLQLCVNVKGSVETSVFGPCKPGTTIAAYAVNSKRGVMTADILGDERFPLGVGMNDSQAKSVICIPVLQPNGDIPAVLELIRHYNSDPFTQADYHRVSTCLLWMGIAIDKTQVCTGLVKQREFNDFLLEVSRVIFDDCVAIDVLTEHIMKFAKDLVNADRCTLFLVDRVAEELYADLFDEGLVKDGKPFFTKKKQISSWMPLAVHPEAAPSPV